jgi:hypothetical protein
VIDMIAPIIPAEKRRTIPWVALVFWLWWTVIFLWDLALIERIYQWVQLGAWAVGANEVINTVSTAVEQQREKNKLPQIHDEESLSDLW